MTGRAVKYDYVSRRAAALGQDVTRGANAPSPCHSSASRFSSRIMSHTQPTASSSSDFQLLFNAALEAYERKTKNRLLAHPLAAQLQSCDSPAAILSVLQDLIQQFDCRRRSDERLSKWLSPTVNVLYTLSATLGQGVGLVSLNRYLTGNCDPIVIY